MVYTLRVLGCVALLAACGGDAPGSGPSARASSANTPPRPPPPQAPTVSAQKIPPAIASALNAVQQFGDRLCACTDLECGQKALDEKGAEMEALFAAAGKDARELMQELRKRAFGCMDKLVAASPAEKSAVQGATDLATALCAAKDAAEVKKVIAARQPDFDKAFEAQLSEGGSAAVRRATRNASECLEKLGYHGSTLPGLAAKAKAEGDKVCACTEVDCANRALADAGKLFARAYTPDDLAVVRTATERVTECVRKIKH